VEPGLVDENCQVTSCEQIWSAVKNTLASYGALCGSELGEYDCTGFEGQLSCQDLSDLIDSIRGGDANCSVSGLPPPTPQEEAPPPSSGPEEIEQAPLSMAESEDDREWTGLAQPMNKEMDMTVIYDAKTFKKLWKRLRDDELPVVDFDKAMVMGIIAGKEDRADRIEIQSIVHEEAGIAVRYRLPEPALRNKRTTVPYLLKVVGRSDKDVTFDLVEERPHGETKGGKPEH
jgi:hypothetical protein